ncbi:MAG: transketolase C-terminal domain-containing protein [Candidatus Beckwithbacteria bacterium]
MRLAFVKTLEKLAEKDERIVLLTADLGFTVFEDFKEKFPNRFFNLGVAESNMMGMAAGMALSGLIPITYSIANFVSFRPYEFIRNDICYQNANVKIFSVGGGLGYGLAGSSHCNYEDISVLRPLPNLTILSPSDPLETKILTQKAIEHKGPVYLRLGKVGEPNLHSTPPNLKLGHGYTLHQGKKMAIFVTGGISANVLSATKLLKAHSIDPTIILMPTIKPLDKNLIIKTANNHSHIFSIEEHSIIGGLGSALAEVLAESGSKVKFKRLGIGASFSPSVGNQVFLRARHGLSPQKIATTVKKIILS